MPELMLDEAQSVYFQTGKERDVDFALNFSERSARPFVCRLTGGCAYMTAADGIGMRNLSDGLRGNVKDSHGHFAGFALFGGTRMLSIHDPKIVVPGITEIFPSVAPDCPGTVMLGIIPAFRNVRRSRHPDLADKMILSVEEKKGVITVVHPEVQSVLFVKPTPDNQEIWDDEYKECFKYIRGLHERNWQSLLIVYNGGTVTRREVDLWAHWGLREPGRWKVLLIKNSGRTADELANDAAFLSGHPDVHVAENDPLDIHKKLWTLGALVPKAHVDHDDVDNKIIPIRRAS